MKNKTKILKYINFFYFLKIAKRYISSSYDRYHQDNYAILGKLMRRIYISGKYNY